MTGKSDIRGWLERGKEQGATHLFVVCDTFDWDDYPVFKNCTPEQAKEEAGRYPREMQKLMEVYRLDQDWDAQLDQRRAFNY